MSDNLYTKTINKIIEEQGFDWDDYLFLLNNEDIYEKIDLLSIVEDHYEETNYEPSVIYNKKDILNATCQSYLQVDFLRKNNMINDDEWVESDISDYKKLSFINKTLSYYYDLYRLIKDLYDRHALKEQFGYDIENYKDFFKKYLKNINITYTKGYMNHRSVKKYEVI